MAAFSVLISLAFWGAIIWFIVSRVRRSRGVTLPPSQNVHIPQPMGLPSPAPGQLYGDAAVRSEPATEHDHRDRH